jgi:putative SOS response-associated peptidase YedK
MCGRFTFQLTPDELQFLLDLELPEDKGRNFPPRYNIAPTQDVLFAVDRDGQRKLVEGRWWLVPFWAKEMPKFAMFNARSEDAHTKPSFRDAFKSKRCLIPADGYFEWTKGEDGGKDPHYILLSDHEPFAFAGLWAHNIKLDITSCTILTASAAKEIRHIHDRMPIILENSSFDDWLSAETSVDDARELLTENRGHELVSYRVSRAVNGSKTEGAELIDPID